MHVDLYGRFTEARPATEGAGRIMPYDWTGMLDDLAREIANAMNAFAINVRRLHAWGAVLDTLGEDDRTEAIHEFVSKIAESQAACKTEMYLWAGPDRARS